MTSVKAFCYFLLIGGVASAAVSAPTPVTGGPGSGAERVLTVSNANETDPVEAAKAGCSLCATACVEAEPAATAAGGCGNEGAGEKADASTDKPGVASLPFPFECASDEVGGAEESNPRLPAVFFAGAVLALWQVTSLAKRTNG